MEKDASITELLDRLREALVPLDWIAIDHWDADLCAVGIAPRSAPRRLVYVSTYEKSPGRYYFECECPTGTEPHQFEVVERGDNASFDDLVRAVRAHLLNPGNPGPSAPREGGE